MNTPKLQLNKIVCKTKFTGPKTVKGQKGYLFDPVFFPGRAWLNRDQAMFSELLFKVEL